MLRTTFLRGQILLMLAGLAAVMVAVPASAQSEPSPITALAGSTRPFTDAERRQIREWADYYARDLASGSPDRVAQGKRRLMEPLRGQNVRLLFREEYSRVVIERVERIVDNDASIFVAINALQAAALLGTESAARLMLNRADPDIESRPQVRLWAAHGIRTVIREGALDEARLPTILRELSRVASRETDWMVLHRHFEAFAAVNLPAARDRQLTLLGEVLDRIERDNSSPHELMRSVHAMLVLFRDQFINLSSTDQRPFGTAAAPHLARVFDVASKHWERLDRDHPLASPYSGAVAMSERMLRLIDQQVRGAGAAPNTSIESAWNERNRTNFVQGIERWMAVVSQPPYAEHR
jgi:hypothetical protein